MTGLWMHARPLQEHGHDARRPHRGADPRLLPCGALAAGVHRERPRARARRHLQAADARARVPPVSDIVPGFSFSAGTDELLAANTEGNRFSGQRRHYNSAERLRSSGKALRGGCRSVAHDSRRVRCFPAAPDAALAQALEGNRRYRTERLTPRDCAEERVWIRMS